MMSIVMLLDRSAAPLFPPWAGYFNLWAAICLLQVLILIPENLKMAQINTAAHSP